MGTVFVSHRATEQADADRLREGLEPHWAVVTHPISPEGATTWREECRRLIASADAVIVIIGDRTAESPNVGWELQTALERGMPVLAVRAEHADAPPLPGPVVARVRELLEPEDLLTRLGEVSLERAG